MRAEEMVESHNLKDGNVLQIFYDNDPCNPRDMSDCYLGKMVCFHKRYRLPNEIDDPRLKDHDNFSGWEHMLKYIKRTHKPKAWLPIYMMDHSGVSIQTVPFNDPWDSGSIGFIFALPEDVKKTFGDNRVSKKTIEASLRSEVAEFDQFLRGEVYGYVVVGPDGADEEEHDSCWGFYGKEHLLSEFKGMISE